MSYLGLEDFPDSKIKLKSAPSFSTGKEDEEIVVSMFPTEGTIEEIFVKNVTSLAVVLAQMENPQDSEKMKARIKEILSTKLT